jgi:hypothetical protein
MKTNILTEEEIESSKRINKKYNDWLTVMNISLPFNIILKYGGLYLKTVTEFSENLTVNAIGSETTELKNVCYNIYNTTNQLEKRIQKQIREFHKHHQNKK